MTTTERVGDWMQTFTGRAFWPLDPRPDEVDPRDIAHALSLVCRYGGHCKRFYSVAEHSVHLSRVVAPEHALWALIHDGAEAYIGDMVRPLKRMLTNYQTIDNQITYAICDRFDLSYVCPTQVKEADNSILVDERMVLMGEAPLPWVSIEDVPALGVQIRCWDPERAELEFLDRLDELGALS